MTASTTSVRAAAKGLRAAQRAYMLDRGNNDLGKAVADAADRLGIALAATEVSTGEVNRAVAHYISASARGPRAAMEAALEALNFGELRAAAMRLYMAGHWSCARPVNEVQLWEDLRDALGLKPGAATKAGVHDPFAHRDGSRECRPMAEPHGCPACDDAMECSCEPPLPMFDEPTAEDRERVAAMVAQALKSRFTIVNGLACTPVWGCGHDCRDFDCSGCKVVGYEPRPGVEL